MKDAMAILNMYCWPKPADLHEHYWSLAADVVQYRVESVLPQCNFDQEGEIGAVEGRQQRMSWFLLAQLLDQS